MSFEAARSAATTFFKTGFTRPAAAGEWFPVEYPNHPVEQGEGEERRAWARFSFTHGTAIGRDVNGGVTRTPGEAVLSIFLPEDTGVKLGLDAGDQVESFMRQKHLTGLPNNGIIRFREVTVREIGNSGDGWYQVNVYMPFERDEQRPPLS